MPQFLSPLAVATPTGPVGYASGTAKALRSGVGASGTLPTLGANLVTNGTFDTNITGWSGTNWAWQAGGTVKHTTGSTASFQNAGTTMTSGQKYLVTLVLGGTTTGSVNLQIVATNVALGLTTGTYYFVFIPSQSSNTIYLNPTTDFNGYVDSITSQLMTGNSTPQFILDAAPGTAATEMRADVNMQTTALGYQAMQTGVGQRSTALGYQALSSISGNADCVAIGNYAIGGAFAGDQNTAVGSNALGALQQPALPGNVAIGFRAGRSPLTGVTAPAVPVDVYNPIGCVFIGNYASGRTTNPQYGVAIGTGAAIYGQGIAIGYNAASSDNNTIAIGTGVTTAGGASSGVALGPSANLGVSAAAGIALGANASVNANYAIALGYLAQSTANGAVAIGTDSSGAGASTAVTNEIKLGTSNHSVNIPGALTVAGIVTPQGGLVGNYSSSGINMMTARVTGDANPRFSIGADGFLSWGTGSVATDAVLYRQSAATLRVNNNFYINRLCNVGMTTDGTTSAYALTFGTSQDTNLYRGGAASLKTDGSLLVVGGLLGTGAGLKLGTATSDKLGFWGTAPVSQRTGWSPTAGYTADRAFDPQSTTMNEIAAVLATLIDDLKSYGLVG